MIVRNITSYQQSPFQAEALNYCPNAIRASSNVMVTVPTAVRAPLREAVTGFGCLTFLPPPLSIIRRCRFVPLALLFNPYPCQIPLILARSLDTARPAFSPSCSNFLHLYPRLIAAGIFPANRLPVRLGFTFCCSRPKQTGHVRPCRTLYSVRRRSRGSRL